MSTSGGESVPARTFRSGLRAAASPAAVVLILAGAFHVYRGVPGEGVLFCAVGLAVAADSAGWLPLRRSRMFRLPAGRASWALAGVGGFALAVLPPHGAVETLALAVIGVVVLSIGWVQPERSGRPDRTGTFLDVPQQCAAEMPDISGDAPAESAGRSVGTNSNGSPAGGSRWAGRYERTTLVWCSFGVAVCLFELAVYLLSDPPLREFEFPTLSTLLEPVITEPLGRLPLLVAWLALGFALLRWSQGGTGRGVVGGTSAGAVGDPDGAGDAPSAGSSSDLLDGET